MTATPITIAECDALLEDTHARYLRAMARLSHIQQDDLSDTEDTEDGDAADAAELWIQLHELIDLRITLPQQRTPSD